MTQTWKTPVVISIGEPPVETTISTIQAAAWAMIEDWPEDDDGPALDAALVACAGAVEGKRKAEDARQAFVAAAKEAGILVKA